MIFLIFFGKRLVTVLIVGFVAYLYLDNQTKIEVQVLKQDLPAYYLIKATDLKVNKYARTDLLPNTLKEKDIEGRYTLTKLSKEKPLNEKQVSSKINSTYLTDTIAIGIPATNAMTLNNNLEAGDIVDITLASSADKLGVSPSALVFPNVLVLDVKSTAQGNPPFTSVIVIALPLKHQQKFATKLPGATILVSRKL